MKILLLGRNGQLGWELQRALAPLGELVVLGRDEEENGLCGDLGRPTDLCATVELVRPDVIVNAAAYTDVDRAEFEPEQAERINTEAPGVLARTAAQLGALLIHYSTDYVFDGSGTGPWYEDDEPGAINVYGATKWRGEEAVRRAEGHHLIFRTEWIYSVAGENFIRTMLRLAAERDVLRIIDDQVGAPTGADLIADVTAHAIRIAHQRPDLAGTYHLTASGEISWYGYACFVIEMARHAGWPIKVAPTAIEPVGTDTFPAGARRPLNSRLSSARLESTFGLCMPDWRQGVQRTLIEARLIRESSSGVRYA